MAAGVNRLTAATILILPAKNVSRLWQQMALCIFLPTGTWEWVAWIFFRRKVPKRTGKLLPIWKRRSIRAAMISGSFLMRKEKAKPAIFLRTGPAITAPIIFILSKRAVCLVPWMV